MKKVISAKDVFKSLSKITPNKSIFVVHGQWENTYSSKSCPSCNGKGVFTVNEIIYECKQCGGTGKATLDSKYVYKVSKASYGQEWPDFEFKGGCIEMGLYTHIKGFFNSKEDAEKLAEKLNKEEVL